MTREMLTENVYLTYVPSEKFKTSFFSAQMVVPLEKKTAALNALLVNVLSRGTARFPSMEALSCRLDELYGARIEPVVRKKGENQVFGFLASCIDDRLLPEGERVLEPLADLIGELFTAPATKNGRLRGDYLDSERENLADLIRSEINDKRSYAAHRLIEEMCCDEAYGVSRLGTADEVEKISLQQFNAHYQAVLPAARLELFYCGAAEQKRVAGMLRRAFAALPRAKGPELAPTLRKEAPLTPKIVRETMEVTQGKLAIGFRIHSMDVAAMMMVSVMLGGTGNSKLFLRVREKLSLCYYIGSSLHRKKGLLTVSAGIAFEHYQQVLDEIFAQLDAMKRGDWEDWELESARRTLRGSLRSTEDSAGAMEDFVMGQLATDGEDTIPGLLAAIEDVTPERIRAAAQTVTPDTIYFLTGKEESA